VCEERRDWRYLIHQAVQNITVQAEEEEEAFAAVVSFGLTG
jgi:hypothetical protein